MPFTMRLVTENLKVQNISFYSVFIETMAS